MVRQTESGSRNAVPPDWVIGLLTATMIGTVGLWILDILGIAKNVLLGGFTPQQ